MPPLLSIVTPCLNAERFLPRCLASVAGQGLEPGQIEHIVLDGGSADRSVDLIAAHAAASPGLVTHWRSEPDGGQSAALNAGFSLARGEYGAWLNADDWYEPGALPRVLAALRDRRPDVLVARARIVDQRGATIWAPTPIDPVTLPGLLRLRTRWYAGRGIVQPEAFFRLDLFRRLGGLDESLRYTMDYRLWLDLAAAGARFEHLDALVATQLAHPGQKTADRAASRREALTQARAALARHRAALGPLTRWRIARELRRFEAAAL